MWSQADGLPQNTIRAINQTADGYLWLGTDDGLARFDGFEFVTYNKDNGALPNNSVRALATGKDGYLWIGTSGGLVRYRDGKFRTFTTRDGLPENLIIALFEDHDGKLWIGAGTRLSLLDNKGKFTTWPAESLLPLRRVASIYEDRSHNLLIAGRGGLTRLTDSRFTPMIVRDVAAEDITSIVDKNDNFWLGGASGLAERTPDGRISTFSTGDGLPSSAVRMVTEDRDGNVWAGTTGGLARFEGNRFVLAHDGGKSQDEVRSIFEDREGNLWVGMKNGLNRFRDDAFTNYGRPEGFPSDEPTAVHQDSAGQVWIGYQDAGLVALGPGGARNYTTRDGLLSDEIFSIRETRHHDLLAVTSKGISILHGGRFANYSMPQQSVNIPVDVLEDRRGQLWVGAAGGLFAATPSGWRNVLPNMSTANPLDGTAVTLHESRDGTLWAGTWGTGLWQLRDGKMRRFTTSDGLSSERIRSIYEDPDGTLWIGTFEGGLNEYRNGAFAHYTAKDGLLSDNIAQIMDDGAGALWLGTTRGISRVTKQQLRDFRAGKIRALSPVNYTTDDGLRSTQCSSGFWVSEGGTRSSDGRLWFPTARGLATITPDASVPKTQAATLVVHIVGVAVDGREISTQGTAPTTIRAGSDHLQFRYRGIHLAAPERVRYEYKLEGLDSGWTQAFDRRAIDYRILRHGSYVFRVRASVPGQSPSEAALGFEILPHFYQQTYFIGLCVISLIGGIYGFHQLRLRQMRSRFSLVLEERARIAREIHDTLAQAFVGISSQLDAVAIETGDRSGKAWRHLELARRMTRHSLTEAKRSVVDLRASELRNRDLSSALATAVCQWRSAKSVAIDLDISGVPRKLPEAVQQNVFRIAQEAVNNTMKHASASKIGIHLEMKPRMLSLTVNDDGKGFEPSGTLSPDDGHLGLLGMRERAESLGGDLDLYSQPGKGTRVQVTVPLFPEDASGGRMHYWLGLVGLKF